MSLKENLSFLCHALNDISGENYTLLDFKNASQNKTVDFTKILRQFDIKAGVNPMLQLIQVSYLLACDEILKFILEEKCYIDFLTNKLNPNIPELEFATNDDPRKVLQNLTTFKREINKSQNFKEAKSTLQNHLLRLTSKKCYFALAFSIFSKQKRQFTNLLIQRYKLLKAYMTWFQGSEQYFWPWINKIIVEYRVFFKD